MIGAALYLVTLTLELPGAALRYALFGLAAAAATSAPLDSENPDTVAAPVAAVAGLGPLLWSLCAFVLPSLGVWWRWRLGGRGPSSREREAYERALVLLEEVGEGKVTRRPRSWFVLDAEEPQAAVRGDALMVSRGLVQHGDMNLAAVLAHELAHTSSLDGRLTEALNRLVLWGDPSGPQRPRIVVLRDPIVAVAWGLATFVLRLAGGGLSQVLLRPLWAAHWRRREYAADTFASGLGQGEELANFLEAHALFFDLPIPFLWASAETHPPVELRIDRLQGNATQIV